MSAALPPLLDRLVPPPPGIPFPPGGEVAILTAADGISLRAAFWAKPAADQPARGTVFVLQGRAEFIEKYSEVFGSLLARGFAVAALDWRGQGGSTRQLASIAKGHVEDFDDFLLDLAALVAEARRRALPEPWHGLAHSMGGAITLAAIARGAAPFARVLFSAPMVKIYGIHEGLARITARTLASLGCSGLFVPFGGKQAIGSKPFEGNVLSSDPARYARAHAWEEAEPRLVIGDPTIGWVDAAFHALDAFDDADFGAANRTPALFLIAGNDQVVISAAGERLARKLRGASAIVIPGARHELLMESDAVQRQVWAAFDAFIGAGSEAGLPPALLIPKLPDADAWEL